MKKKLVALAGVAALSLSLAIPVFAADDRNSALIVYAETADASGEAGNITVTGGMPGVIARSYDGHKATAKTLNIESQANGVAVYSYDANSKTDVTVNGYIKAGEIAVNSDSFINGYSFLTVNGDVSNTGDAPLINISSNNNGKSEIIINGDAIANRNAAIVSAFGGPSGTNTIIVKGDVTSNGTNAPTLAINTRTNVGISNVAIEGTLSGGKFPFEAVAAQNTNSNFAIWKIALTDGHFGYSDYASTTPDEETEMLVSYIIKTDDAVSNKIKLTKEDGSALDTMFDAYSVAKEGAKIVISAADGYELKAVYNGTEKTPIEKDAQGKYILTVPKGGGVLISADCVSNASVNENTDSATTSAAVTTPSTGDNSNLTLYITSMGIAAIAATSAVLVIKKRSEA